MAYMEHWSILAARLSGLQKAGKLYALMQSYHTEDSYGAGRMLAAQCADAVKAIDGFTKQHASALPAVASTRLGQFIRGSQAQAVLQADPDQRAARGALVALAALEGEITYAESGARRPSIPREGDH